MSSETSSSKIKSEENFSFLKNASSEKINSIKGVLRQELEFWETHLAVKLSEESANAFIEALSFHENIPDEVDKNIGFNPRIKGSTKGHSIQVCILSMFINDAIKEKDNYCNPRELAYAALFHDLGKFREDILPIVLSKSNSLSDAEFNKIKEHPEAGAKAITILIESNRNKILGATLDIEKIKEGVRCHHQFMKKKEKGYPKRENEEEIPMIAKIIAAADTYSAIIRKRSYKEARSANDAMSEIKKGAGIQFDSHVASLMIVMRPKEGDFITTKAA